MIIESQRPKMYIRICMPNEDSNQSVHSHSLTRIFSGRIVDAAEFLYVKIVLGIGQNFIVDHRFCETD